jgi:hypothetical protein
MDYLKYQQLGNMSYAKTCFEIIDQMLKSEYKSENASVGDHDIPVLCFNSNLC